MSAEIIIVTYGQPELEARCTASVRQYTDLKRHKLTIVDNFKRDANLAKVWNDAIRISKVDYICLLNSDTTVESGWLDKLIEAADRSRADAVGPMTDHCGNPPQRGSSGEGIQEVKQLSGFCLLLRRSAWVTVKGFREDCPFYGQESNLMTRIGLKIVCRSVFVHHEAGASVKPTGRQSDEREMASEWWARNNRFNWKQRIAVLGAPDSPFPLWQGINQAMNEFKREGLPCKHLDIEKFTARNIQEFRPDVILAVSSRGSNMKRAACILKQFNRIPRGLWFNDLRNAEEGDFCMGAYSRVFLCFQSTPEYNWQEWERRSGAKISYMPQGGPIHPELQSLSIRKPDTVFIGSVGNTQFHGDRKIVTDSLGAEVINETKRLLRIDVEKRSAAIYRQHRFCLSMSPLIPGYSSLRLYNIMAYGGLPLVRRFNGLDRLFTDEKHILGWSSPSDAKKRIIEWLDRPEDAERLRKRAWRYQQARHTVANRLMNMTANLTTPDQSFWGHC